MENTTQKIGFAGIIVEGTNGNLRKWLKNVARGRHTRAHMLAREGLLAAQEYVDTLSNIHADEKALREAYATLAEKTEIYRQAVLSLQEKAAEKTSRFSVKVLDKKSPF